MDNISTHTLTWSVTIVNFVMAKLSFNFNSHAHVERDRKGHILKQLIPISTHTLTWSVTCVSIRIDIIVWRFQLTRSRGA